MKFLDSIVFKINLYVIFVIILVSDLVIIRGGWQLIDSIHKDRELWMEIISSFVGLFCVLSIALIISIRDRKIDAMITKQQESTNQNIENELLDSVNKDLETYKKLLNGTFNNQIIKSEFWNSILTTDLKYCISDIEVVNTITIAYQLINEVSDFEKEKHSDKETIEPLKPRAEEAIALAIESIRKHINKT